MADPNGTYIRGRFCMENENVKATKYKSCEMEIGFDTIFIRYPKFILKTNISFSNLLIKSPMGQNNNYYYFTPNHRESPCWIFKNQTESLPLNMFHGQMPRTYCFLDSGAKTGIWSYNYISICKDCDEMTIVWLRMPSTLWATIISIIVVLACISIGMTLGFLLLGLNPKLLRGSDGVVLLQNIAADHKHSCTIFVMPSNWKNLRRQIERFSLHGSKSLIIMSHIVPFVLLLVILMILINYRSRMSRIEQQRSNINDNTSFSSCYHSINTNIGPVHEDLDFKPTLSPRPKPKC